MSGKVLTGRNKKAPPFGGADKTARLCLSGFLFQRFFQHLQQVRDIQRLCDVAVHARIQGVLLVLLKGVGGHGKNGDACLAGVGQSADTPGGFVAVHPGHLDVHQNQVVLPGHGLLHLFHCFNAVSGGIHKEARFL